MNAIFFLLLIIFAVDTLTLLLIFRLIAMNRRKVRMQLTFGSPKPK